MKSTFKRIVRISAATVILLSMCVSQIFFDPIGAAAAGDKTTEQLANSVEAMSEEAAEPSAKRPNLPTAAYTTDFQWDDTQIMHGIVSSADLYFKIPNYWKPVYACMKLEYNLSSTMKDNLSSLTFSINGEPFYSCKVDYKAGEKQTVYVQIPLNLLKNDIQSSSNYLTVTGYSRLSSDDECIDEDSDANWITLGKNSGVEMGYDLVDAAGSLSLYPFPYVSSVNQTGKNTSIAIASPDDDTAVADSMLIMQNLSTQCKKINDLEAGPYNEITELDRQNLIVISLTKDLPEQFKATVSQFESQLKDNVLIISDKSIPGKNVLLIVSDTSEGLAEAPSFLADSNRLSQVNGISTLIKIGTTKKMADSRLQNALNVNQFTFEEMTGGGMDFLGAFNQEKTLFLPVSSDYTLSPSAKVSLKFRYSKNLDFNRSVFTVYWGDVPIASKKLELDKADGDELTFTVPSDVAGTNSTSMKFNFNLQIPEAKCIKSHDLMSWAYITKDSMLYLPTGSDVPMQFDNIPAPFQKGGLFNELLLVTTDNRSINELTLLGRVLALYGNNADPYSTLKVKKAKDLNTNAADYNIITTGTPQDNSFIKKLNDNLFFKYDDAGTQFLTNNKLILTDDYSKSVGSMQLLESPYAKNRALLVVTGPNDTALSSVRDLVSDSTLSWNIKKDCVLVDASGKAKTFQFKSTKSNEDKPSFAKTIADNKTSLLFALAATAIMIVFFLAAVLILIRSRVSKNKKK